MGYRYLEQMTEAYNILLLKNTADFKKAIENLSENKVVLAHGFCTRCQQISYYVSDCNQGIRSHICSECGGRFFVNGYKGYIAMEDLNGSAIEENIKSEIKRLNSILVQKKILRDVLEQAYLNRNHEIYKIQQECDELTVLKKSII